MTTIISNVRTRCGRIVNVEVAAGLIKTIVDAADSGPVQDGAAYVDGSGYLILPPLVDAHAHLDKTVLGMDWFVNDLGDRLTDRIENERTMRSAFGLDPFVQAKRLIENALAAGTLFMRTHVDVDTVNGLDLLEGVRQALKAYENEFTGEIVAFPQSGLLKHEGSYELMADALRHGADVVGGLDPSSFDRDPVRSIAMTFDLAEKFGKPVDIHLHEPGELGAFTMSLIAEKTISCGMQGKVALSHALCVGSQNKKLVAATLEKLAEAQISIVTAGQAYVDSIPQIKEVQAAGVHICGGNDNVRDMWSPYGSADMIERAMFIAMKNYYRRDLDLELAFDVCSREGARLLNVDYPELAVGNRADFVLVRARNLAEAVAVHPADRLVFKSGRLIAEHMELVS